MVSLEKTQGILCQLGPVMVRHNIRHNFSGYPLQPIYPIILFPAATRDFFQSVIESNYSIKLY